MECDKNKVGEGSEGKQSKYFPKVINELNSSTVTDSLCNSGAFSNPNAVRDCPFNLKGAWFLSRSRKFFSYAALLFLKLFSAAQQNIFYKRKYYFM
jgi:hypothetical protein